MKDGTLEGPPGLGVYDWVEMMRPHLRPFDGTKQK